MTYYIFLVFIDIGLFLSENWKELSFTAIASGIGVIVGRRVGTRLAFHYALRLMGINHKSTLERKVEWLVEQEKGRGNVWSAESQGLGKRTIGLKLPSGLRMKYLAPIVTRFTRLRVTEKSIYSRRKNMKEYLKKLGSRKFKAFIIITITNILMLIGYIMNVEGIQDIADGWMPAINLGAQLVSTVVYQMVEGKIDAKREEAKPFILGESAVDYSKSDSTAE